MKSLYRPNHQSAFRFNHNKRKALITSCAGVYMISDYGQGDRDWTEQDWMSSSCRPELSTVLYLFFYLYIFPCFRDSCMYTREGKRKKAVVLMAGICLSMCAWSGVNRCNVSGIGVALLTRESSQTVTLPRCPFPVWMERSLLCFLLTARKYLISFLSITVYIESRQ